MSISNCKFINNSAHWFGGAIASENECGISITGTTFENCRSVDDAGGAIYAFSTDLEVKDSIFNNCSANFAGAICSLNSEMLISYSNFTNNLARYEGGAIYKMYGSGTVIKSNFTKNAALMVVHYLVITVLLLKLETLNLYQMQQPDLEEQYFPMQILN